MKKLSQISISQQNKLLLFSFFILIGVYSTYLYLTQEKISLEKEKIYADTLIPKGYVLVPIELENIGTISALIDQFGVIDLYTGSPQSQGTKKIASRVKVLRAPLNPNQYAVLVTEVISTQIMSSAGPYWGVIQNRTALPNEINQKQAVQKPQIEYFKGGS